MVDGSVTVTLGQGGGLRFDSLPYGTSYSIRESDYTAEGYTTATVSNDGDTSINGNQASGEQLQFGGTYVTYTNSRNLSPPTGLFAPLSPFLAVALLSLGAGALWLCHLYRVRKRRGEV